MENTVKVEKKMTEEKKRLGYLDVLRALAMIPVFTVHFTESMKAAMVDFPVPILPTNVFGVYLGNVGVSVFFIISGASLMCVYGGKKLQVGTYFKKRFLAMLPMYWIAYGAVFLWYRPFGHPAGMSLGRLFYTLIGMDGYLAWVTDTYYLLGEWFLGCIILLYVLFPVIKWGLEKSEIATWLAVLLLIGAGPFLYNGSIPDEIFFLFRVPEFLFGMWFVKKGKKVPHFVAICSALILIFLSFYSLDFIPVVYRNPIVGISVFFLVVWICQWIKNDGFYRIFKVLGQHGYAVLLTHHIISNWLAGKFVGQSISGVQNLGIYCIYLGMIIVASAGLFQINRLLLKGVNFLWKKLVKGKA